MYKYLFHFLITCGIFFLTSCAPQSALIPTPASINDTSSSIVNRDQSLAQLKKWHIAGKLGVKTNQDAGSVIFSWNQTLENYQLSFSGPLGAHSMSLNGTPTHAVLKNEQGKELSGSDAESLVATQTGWKLPVAYLQYWVKGVPAPHSEHRSTFDKKHRLTSLVQAGWIIRYLDYTNINHIDLPSRMSLQTTGLDAKLLIYSWKF